MFDYLGEGFAIARDEAALADPDLYTRDYREAAAAFRSAVAIGDTPARFDETLRIMGGGAMQGERWAEAAALYEELRGRGDNSAATLNNLAYAYAAIGKYDAALPLPGRLTHRAGKSRWHGSPAQRRWRPLYRCSIQWTD